MREHAYFKCASHSKATTCCAVANSGKGTPSCFSTNETNNSGAPPRWRGPPPQFPQVRMGTLEIGFEGEGVFAVFSKNDDQDVVQERKWPPRFGAAVRKTMKFRLPRGLAGMLR